MLSSLAYSCGNVIGQRSVSRDAGARAGDGLDARRDVTLLPFAILQRPDVRCRTATRSCRSWRSPSLGTALAQLVLYRMRSACTARRRMSLVTYLMPGFALVYGAVLLDEPITGSRCWPGSA